MSETIREMLRRYLSPNFLGLGEPSDLESDFSSKLRFQDPLIALDDLREERPHDWYELFDDNPEIMLMDTAFVRYLRSRCVPVRAIAGWMEPVVPGDAVAKALLAGGYEPGDLADGLRDAFPSASHGMENLLRFPQHNNGFHYGVRR